MMRLSKSLNWHSLVYRFFSTDINIKYPDRDKIIFGMRLGLLWASAAVGVVGLLFGFDFIGEALERCLIIVFEVVQENLESMYRKGFKLDLYHAQMATAYTGFVALAGPVYFLFRKFSAAFKVIQAIWNRERVKACELWLKHCDNIKGWWNTLDGFNKVFATLGLVVLAIPLLTIVCFALWKVVAGFV